MIIRSRCYYVYILTNVHRTVLYTGVTNDLEQRLVEHYRNRGQNHSFAGRYCVFYLLYYEPHQYINNAIARETEIKKWSRAKKMKLITEFNPKLEFLNEKVFGCWPPKETPVDYKIQQRLLSDYSTPTAFIIDSSLRSE